MIAVKSKALDETVQVERVLGEYSQQKKGPTVVFVAGIHGNEPSGIFAVRSVLKTLNENKIRYSGNFYGLTGNLSALEQSRRFIDHDLNRIWVDIRENGVKPDKTEIRERAALVREFERIIRKHDEPIYIIDLHTTSSYSVPFLVLGDTLRNREIADSIPAPIILGLEEQTDGTMFSFLNRIGISSILFESGQHDSLSAIENHVAFIWLVLAKIGSVNSQEIKDFSRYRQILRKETLGVKKYYETIYRYDLSGENSFRMNEGFVSFQKVESGQELASNEKGPITAPVEGIMFMPLYQEQGEDGFFIIRKVSKFWLRVSVRLRKLELDKLFRLLPGIKRHPSIPDAFIVNKKVAVIFPVKIFHLFGYRKIIDKGDTFIALRRRYDYKGPSHSELLDNFERHS